MGILLTSKLKKDIIEWDVHNWSKVLNYWQPILDRFSDKAEVKVLALAERNGGLSLWLALQGFKPICSDVGGPTQMAREMHSAHGVQKLVVYEDVNIFDIPYDDETFDLVICKSVIGGLKTDPGDPSTRTIANQSLALEQVFRVLRKGGYFLGAENTRGSLFHKIVRVASGKKVGWRHLSNEEIDELFENFKSVKQKGYGYFGTFYPLSLINSLANVLDTVISGIFPRRWLYISFIIAQK